MSLTIYKKKRSFDATPEPIGGKGKEGELRFVIQKHAASRLHYDFRLEMGGVLKSWAVPKGPSLDPEVKRLAMMVEDHPYDYKDFEGIIPEGNYGAGTVIVWDEGTYEPLEEPGSRLHGEKLLLKQLRSGSLKFSLKGKKLKGEFALVRTRGMGDNAWLLIKHNDKYAKDIDITLKDRSVVSGKTLEKMTRTADKEWIGGVGNRKTAAAKKTTTPKKVSAKKTATKKTAVKKTAVKKTAVKKTAAKKSASKSKTAVKAAPTATRIMTGKSAVALTAAMFDALLAKGKKSRFPASSRPMLATLTEAAFDDRDWEYEIKWDGYRALAFLNKKEYCTEIAE